MLLQPFFPAINLFQHQAQRLRSGFRLPPVEVQRSLEAAVAHQDQARFHQNRLGRCAQFLRREAYRLAQRMPSPELITKRLELLLEAVPGISRVAVLTDAGVDYLLPEMTPTAQRLGVTLYPINVPTIDQLDHAGAALMTVRAEALLVLPAALFLEHVRRVVTLAATSRLPTLYPYRFFVVGGGLMSYGPNRADTDRRVAVYVDKLLKGARPADLPVEQPMNFELVINLETAQALGITIPSLILFQATEVIK